METSRALSVLLATPDYPPSTGGIQTLLHGLVQHRKNVEYDVVTLGDGSKPHDDDNGVVRRVSRVSGPQMASVALLNAYVAGFAKMKRYDVILSGHIVVAAGVAIARRPWVQYAYAKELTHRPRLASTVLPRAHRVIAISRHTEEMALASGTNPQRIRLIPPGIPPVPGPAGTRRTPDDCTVLTISRLDDEHKGTDVLLRAFALAKSRVPRAKLCIIGEGRLRPGLEQLAITLGVRDAVDFLGRVGDKERDSRLDSCAVFSMLSRVPPGGGGEGFGIVFAEAAARGVPVLAGDAGGARDAVDRDRTGLLVDPLSVDGAADAIVHLLENRRLREELGRAGERWAERFAWTSVVSQVEQLLAEAARTESEPQT